MLIEINELMTVSDVARLKGVTRKTVYKWIGSGIAPAHVTICGTHYFIRSALPYFIPPTRGKKAHASD